MFTQNINQYYTIIHTKLIRSDCNLFRIQNSVQIISNLCFSLKTEIIVKSGHTQRLPCPNDANIPSMNIINRKSARARRVLDYNTLHSGKQAG